MRSLRLPQCPCPAPCSCARRQPRRANRTATSVRSLPGRDPEDRDGRSRFGVPGPWRTTLKGGRVGWPVDRGLFELVTPSRPDPACSLRDRPPAGECGVARRWRSRSRPRLRLAGRSTATEIDARRCIEPVPRRSSERAGTAAGPRPQAAPPCSVAGHRSRSARASAMCRSRTRSCPHRRDAERVACTHADDPPRGGRGFRWLPEGWPHRRRQCAVAVACRRSKGVTAGAGAHIQPALSWRAFRAGLRPRSLRRRSATLAIPARALRAVRRKLRRRLQNRPVRSQQDASWRLPEANRARVPAVWRAGSVAGSGRAT